MEQNLIKKVIINQKKKKKTKNLNKTMIQFYKNNYNYKKIYKTNQNRLIKKMMKIINKI